MALVSFRPIIFHFLLLLILVPHSNATLNPGTPAKRNVSSFLSDSDSADAAIEQQKKLRRVPHVFSKVLELPLNSDADVSVEERPDCFKFAVVFDCTGHVNFRAMVVESHPGVNKVVVRGDGGVLVDGLDVDVWRVRLPEFAWLEAAAAVCRDGQLLVTVPKIGANSPDLHLSG